MFEEYPPFQKLIMRYDICITFSKTVITKSVLKLALPRQLNIQMTTLNQEVILGWGYCAVWGSWARPTNL